MLLSPQPQQIPSLAAIAFLWLASACLTQEPLGGKHVFVGTELRIVRVPEEEANPDPFAARGAADPFALPGGTKSGRMVEIAQLFHLIVVREVAATRVLAGGRIVRHGTTLGFDAAGNKLTHDTYCNGVSHGPSARWFTNGHLAEYGAFVNGHTQGSWTNYLPTERFDPHRIDYFRHTASWDAGEPHGYWELRSPAGQPLVQASFDHGRLVSPPPPGCDEGLAKLMAVGAIDADLLYKLFLPQPKREFVEMPLRDIVWDVLDDAHVSGLWGSLGSELPQAVDFRVEAGLPLMVVIRKILEPHKLTSDYRYGMLWVVPHGLNDWKDPTGVAQIVPPAGSQLEQVWNQPVSAEFVETPLVDALDYLAIKTNGKLKFGDMRNIPSWGRVTLFATDHPLRHVLGLTLYQGRYRCRLEGETLILEEQPPE